MEPMRARGPLARGTASRPVEPLSESADADFRPNNGRGSP